MYGVCVCVCVCVCVWTLSLAVATSLGLAEGSELIDPTVIRGAINYLIRNQEESGRFPVLGRLHNYYLLVCKIKITQSDSCEAHMSQYVNADTEFSSFLFREGTVSLDSLPMFSLLSEQLLNIPLTLICR